MNCRNFWENISEWFPVAFSTGLNFRIFLCLNRLSPKPRYLNHRYMPFLGALGRVRNQPTDNTFAPITVTLSAPTRLPRPIGTFYDCCPEYFDCNCYFFFYLLEVGRFKCKLQRSKRKSTLRDQVAFHVNN